MSLPGTLKEALKAGWKIRDDESDGNADHGGVEHGKARLTHVDHEQVIVADYEARYKFSRLRRERSQEAA